MEQTEQNPESNGKSNHDALAEKIAKAVSRAIIEATPQADPAVEAAKIAAIGQAFVLAIGALFQGVHGCQTLHNAGQTALAEQHTKRVGLVTEASDKITAFTVDAIEAVGSIDPESVAHAAADCTLRQLGAATAKL